MPSPERIPNTPPYDTEVIPPESKAVNHQEIIKKYKKPARELLGNLQITGSANFIQKIESDRRLTDDQKTILRGLTMTQENNPYLLTWLTENAGYFFSEPPININKLHEFYKKNADSNNKIREDGQTAFEKAFNNFRSALEESSDTKLSIKKFLRQKADDLRFETYDAIHAPELKTLLPDMIVLHGKTLGSGKLSPETDFDGKTAATVFGVFQDKIIERIQRFIENSDEFSGDTEQGKKERLTYAASLLTKEIHFIKNGTDFDPKKLLKRSGKFNEKSRSATAFFKENKFWKNDQANYTIASTDVGTRIEDYTTTLKLKDHRGREIEGVNVTIQTFNDSIGKDDRCSAQMVWDEFSNRKIPRALVAILFPEKEENPEELTLKDLLDPEEQKSIEGLLAFNQEIDTLNYNMGDKFGNQDEDIQKWPQQWSESLYGFAEDVPYWFTHMAFMVAPNLKPQDSETLMKIYDDYTEVCVGMFDFHPFTKEKIQEFHGELNKEDYNGRYTKKIYDFLVKQFLIIPIEELGRWVTQNDLLDKKGELDITEPKLLRHLGAGHLGAITQNTKDIFSQKGPQATLQRKALKAGAGLVYFSRDSKTLETPLKALGHTSLKNLTLQEIAYQRATDTICTYRAQASESKANQHKEYTLSNSLPVQQGGPTQTFAIDISGENFIKDNADRVINNMSAKIPTKELDIDAVIKVFPTGFIITTSNSPNNDLSNTYSTLRKNLLAYDPDFGKLFHGNNPTIALVHGGNMIVCNFKGKPHTERKYLWKRLFGLKNKTPHPIGFFEMLGILEEKKVYEQPFSQLKDTLDLERREGVRNFRKELTQEKRNGIRITHEDLDKPAPKKLLSIFEYAFSGRSKNGETLGAKHFADLGDFEVALLVIPKKLRTLSLAKRLLQKMSENNFAALTPEEVFRVFTTVYKSKSSKPQNLEGFLKSITQKTQEITQSQGVLNCLSAETTTRSMSPYYGKTVHLDYYNSKFYPDSFPLDFKSLKIDTCSVTHIDTHYVFYRSKSVQHMVEKKLRIQFPDLFQNDIIMDTLPGYTIFTQRPSDPNKKFDVDQLFRIKDFVKKFTSGQ